MRLDVIIYFCPLPMLVWSHNFSASCSDNGNSAVILLSLTWVTHMCFVNTSLTIFLLFIISLVFIFCSLLYSFIWFSDFSFIVIYTIDTWLSEMWFFKILDYPKWLPLQEILTCLHKITYKKLFLPGFIKWDSCIEYPGRVKGWTCNLCWKLERHRWLKSKRKILLLGYIVKIILVISCCLKTRLWLLALKISIKRTLTAHKKMVSQH